MYYKIPILQGLAVMGVLCYYHNMMSIGVLDWVVVVAEDHEYRVEAPTRWKAINLAVHLYIDETGDPEKVAILMASTLGCYKIGRAPYRRNNHA